MSAKTERAYAYLGQADPLLLILLFAVLQIAVWTGVPTLLNSAPPLDVAESYLWGREGILVSYKHPNLPGLLLEASYQLTGAYGWPAYLLSQISAALACLFVYLLGCEFMPPRRAAAGTLLLAGSYYFSVPMIQFNHNVIQVPIWAAFGYFLWKAVERNGFLFWMIVGLISGLAMYAKFSAAFLLIAAMVWLFIDPRGRACLATWKPWLAFGFFVAALVPLAIQLLWIDFMPFYVAIDHSRKNGSNLLTFAASQLIFIAPMFAMITFALREPRGDMPCRAPTAREGFAYLERGRLYLRVLTFVPLALMGILALVSGASIMWGMPMLNFVGLLLMMRLPRLIYREGLARMMVAAAALVAFSALAYAIVLTSVPLLRLAVPLPLVPQPAMSQRMSAVWGRATGSPLKIVGGERYVAWMVALSAPDRPSIYTYPYPFAPPWITPRRVDREGVLVVWEERGNGPPDRWRRLIAGRDVGEESFDWSTFGGSPPLKIGYAIIRPARMGPTSD
jgi:4-amino-4-deoxy-L-arabinose transferase-like glycosyltransferase